MGLARQVFLLYALLLLASRSIATHITSCSNRNVVFATNISVNCDSPGTYYYGSQNYRGSLVCKSGDYANILVYLNVTEQFKSEYIYLQVDFGFYDTNYATVLELTELCSLNPYGYRCPTPGRNYTVSTRAQVPQRLSKDPSLAFTPDVRVLFVDDASRLLGCETTGTVAMNNNARLRSRQGLALLGGCVLVLLVVFGILLYLSHRRKAYLQARLEQEEAKKSSLYHYYRAADALPNSIQHPPRLRNDDDSSVGSGMRLDPAYNEPQIPTRPII